MTVAPFFVFNDKDSPLDVDMFESLESLCAHIESPEAEDARAFDSEGRLIPLHPLKPETTLLGFIKVVYPAVRVGTIESEPSHAGELQQRLVKALEWRAGVVDPSKASLVQWVEWATTHLPFAG